MSVAQRYQKLLTRISPSPSETNRYEGHLDTVKRRIKAVYPGSQVQVIGSRYRETALRKHSDLDLLVRIRRKDVHWGGNLVNSTTALNNMRAELQTRLVQTGISRDGCAVVASFGGGAFSIDIVPAFFRTMQHIDALRAQRPIYSIPDGAGQWLLTCPEAHNQFLHAADEDSGGQLKYVARLIKHWCASRAPQTPLFGFHIELVLASHHTCVGAKSYAQCVADALDLLVRRDLADLRDPIGIAGLIPATKTARQRKEALTRLRASAARAASAVDAEHSRNSQEAYRLWGLVFNGTFPKR